MKKLLGLLLFIFLMFSGACNAAQYNILVIPCDIFLKHRDYLVFPDSADIIASDIINYYNAHPKMSAPTVNHLKNVLEQSQNHQLKKETQVLVSRYKNNYTINYDTVQKLASKFKAKQVLLVTCNMDAQNYITRRTLWDFLDIPGATVLDPAYRLSTQVTLIDANNQIVLWQENYQKLLSSRENRIIPQTFSPAGEQLEKVKKYSTKFLAPQIVQETQLAMFKISPYQDLNLKTEIVKPQAISIDKAKIDAKRASIRSGRYIKRETKNYIKTQKANIKTMKAERAKSQDAKAQEKLLPIEDQVKIIQDKNRAKLEKKLAKQQQKAKEKEIKRLAKLQYEKDKQELFKEEPKQKFKFKFNKKVKKDEIKVEEIMDEKVPTVDINTLSPSVIMQQNLQPVPYVRTKPILREDDFTINDY